MKKMFLLCLIAFSIITHSLCAKIAYSLVDGLPDIYISDSTEKIGHTWQKGVVWDKELIRKFYSLLPTDTFFVVLDVGAQTGSFSLLAKYFPNSKWYSFEPIQEAVDALYENLTLNNIHNVTIVQKAVADFSGKVTLKMPPMNMWGLATIGSHPHFQTTDVRKIDCIDLDSFVQLNNIEKVHFMKLDTEGAELFVLRGARKMIMRDHPVILMEYSGRNAQQCGVTTHEIDSFLREMGYAWKLVSVGDILCIPSKDL